MINGTVNLISNDWCFSCKSEIKENTKKYELQNVFLCFSHAVTLNLLMSHETTFVITCMILRTYVDNILILCPTKHTQRQCKEKRKLIGDCVSLYAFAVIMRSDKQMYEAISGKREKTQNMADNPLPRLPLALIHQKREKKTAFICFFSPDQEHLCELCLPFHPILALSIFPQFSFPSFSSILFAVHSFSPFFLG